MGNPFHTYAGLSGRCSHSIHVYLHNDPQVLGYRVWGASSIDDAYGDPADSGVGGSGSVLLFGMDRESTFQSPTVRRNKMDMVPENRRGTTHAIFDVDDYLGAGLGLMPDNFWLYLRVQENRNGIGLLTVPGPLPVLGPVYCVPPPKTFGLPLPTFTAQGIAPSGVVGVAAGAPPPFSEDLTTAAPRPLYLVFPVPIASFALRNLDAAKTLLVSFGPGQLMMEIPPGIEVREDLGTTKALILACPDAGGCAYSLHGVLRRT